MIICINPGGEGYKRGRGQGTKKVKRIRENAPFGGAQDRVRGGGGLGRVHQTMRLK